MAVKFSHLPSLRALYNDPKFSDVIVNVGTREFFVSRAILAAWSPALAACLASRKDKHYGVCRLCIKNVDPETVELLLEFFYFSDEANLLSKLTPLAAWKLLLLCDLLCVENLLPICQDFLIDWLSRKTGWESCISYRNGTTKSESNLRLAILLTCLRRDRYSPAFSKLHRRALHLIITSTRPSLEKNPQVCCNGVDSDLRCPSIPKLISPLAGYKSNSSLNPFAKPVNQDDHAFNGELSEQLPSLTSPERIDVEQIKIPLLLLRLRLTDFRTVLASDTIEAEENVLLQWSLVYAALYGQLLARKYAEDGIRRRRAAAVAFSGTPPPSSLRHKRGSLRLTPGPTPMHTPSPRSAKCLRRRDSEAVAAARKQSELCCSADREQHFDITVECPLIVESFYDEKAALIPEELDNLTFADICSYFELSAPALRSLLKDTPATVSVCSTSCPMSSLSSLDSPLEDDISDPVDSLQSTQQPYDDTVSSGGSPLLCPIRKLSDTSSASSFTFLSFFFEGYIYAALEPYLRYSLLHPVRLAQLRRAHFCSKRMVTDAAFCRLEGYEHISSQREPIVAMNPAPFISLHTPCARRRLSGAVSPLFCPSQLASPLLLRHIRQRICRCVRNHNFSLLPSLISQYSSLVSRRRRLPFRPDLIQQSAIPRSTLPFSWRVADRTALVLSGSRSQTVTVRLAAAAPFEWLGAWADRGCRSGVHEWFLRIDHSSFNNIIVGVAEFHAGEDPPYCRRCYHSQGTSRSLVLYNRQLRAGCRGQTPNDATTCTTASGRRTSGSSPTDAVTHPPTSSITTAPSYSRRLQPLAGDVIVVRLDMRAAPGHLFFYCVRQSMAAGRSSGTVAPSLGQPETLDSLGGGFFHDQHHGAIHVWELGRLSDVDVTLPFQKEWRLFVDLRDIEDSVTLIPHQHDIVQHLPPLSFTLS